MTVDEFAKKHGLKLLNDPEDTGREIEGCYIGDLLSWVMGRASPGDMWITVMSNINIVAVAQLSDAACVVLCEDVVIDDNVRKKADSQGIAIYSSPKTGYEIAVDYYNDSVAEKGAAEAGS